MMRLHGCRRGRRCRTTLGTAGRAAVSAMKRSPAPIKVSLAGGRVNEAGEMEGALRCCERPACENAKTLKAIAGAVATTSGLPLCCFSARSKFDEK